MCVWVDVAGPRGGCVCVFVWVNEWNERGG